MFIKKKYRVLKNPPQLQNRRFYFRKTRASLSFSSIMAGIARASDNSGLYGISSTGAGLMGGSEFLLLSVRRGWVSASPVAVSLVNSSTNLFLAGASFL
jgi:hypothetical protein